MTPKLKGKILEKLTLPALVLALLGFIAIVVGIVFLFLKKFLVGGIVAGAGLLALAGGIWGVILLLFFIDRTHRMRSRQISEDAYYVQGDWYVSFTAEGMEVINAEKPEERPCIPYDEIKLWSYYAYKLPIAKGHHKYTVRIATKSLPAEMEHIDRTKQKLYLDIDEARLAETLKKFNVAVIEKTAQLEEKPVKVAEYGRITVFDSGVFLAGLWMYDRSRFLPWEDVETITHEDDELVFDCGYQRVRAHFDENFYRDLEANYPDKIPPEPTNEIEETEEPAEEVEELAGEAETEPVSEKTEVETENEPEGNE